jgi:hypothetical protein
MNPKTTLGGVALGKHYCEVIVNVVLKRDTILPRPYPGVEKWLMLIMSCRLHGHTRE